MAKCNHLQCLWKTARPPSSNWFKKCWHLYHSLSKCYNHCQQNEFMRLLFYVLVKISVATGPKTFNALCATLRDDNNPTASDLLSVLKFSVWFIFPHSFAASAAWEAKSSTNQNAEYKNVSVHSLLLSSPACSARLWSLHSQAHNLNLSQSHCKYNGEQTLAFPPKTLKCLMAFTTKIPHVKTRGFKNQVQLQIMYS